MGFPFGSEEHEMSQWEKTNSLEHMDKNKSGRLFLLVLNVYTIPGKELWLCFVLGSMVCSGWMAGLEHPHTAAFPT